MQGMQLEWGEEECVWDFGGKARRDEISRKTKTYAGELRWIGWGYVD
jgi:hypothetical protein